jgi:hypothetical protein
VVLVLLLAGGAAGADDWVPIGKTPDGKTRVYIDTSGVQVAGAIRRAWIRDVFKPHTRHRIGSKTHDWADYAASHVGVNCTDSTYWEDALVWYDESGVSFQTPPGQISAQWTAINPVKIVDQEMQFICSWKPD